MEDKKKTIEKSTQKKKTVEKPTQKKKPIKKVEKKNIEKPIQKAIVEKQIKKDENVVEPKLEITKKKENTFKTLEVLILIAVTFVVTSGMAFGLYKIRESKKETISIKDPVLQQFIENYNYILDNYYNDIDKEDLLNGAIEGMVASLGDDYSTIITEDEEEQFNIKLTGVYQGLGIEIKNNYELLKDSDGNITGYIYKDIEVIQVFKDSPADKAGLKAGDIILAVNDISMSGKLTSDLTSEVKKITSKNFTLKIKRDEKEQTLTVSKEVIEIPSVTAEEKDDYAYIKIVDVFAANTDEQFSKAIDALSTNVKGIIIDVRDNSGGHLSSVENMLSKMMDKSKVLYQLDNKGTITKIYSTGKKTLDYKVVVLMNENSASASELLAISLKESYGATLVGTTTYGKGSVQELTTIKLTSAQYKITTKKWLSPNGNSIDKVGIAPDVEVKEANAQYEEAVKQIETLLKK